ncbi:hypothetical protein ACEQ8H_006286 [Pleosporales sp. CAS-2024a]
MIPRALRIANCFRVPLESEMGRDALFVDLPISVTGSATSTKSIPTISSLLKKDKNRDNHIHAGFFGGDTNSNTKNDYGLHKTPEVDLIDVWEDEPAPIILKLKPFQKDLSLGRARGNTWGYQTEGATSRKRLDKFFYSGQLETMALSESQDVAGRVGRLGIGVKTEVEGWVWEDKYRKLVRGVVKDATKNRYFVDLPPSFRDTSREDVRPVKMDQWVSDHFAIAVGVKIGK